MSFLKRLFGHKFGVPEAGQQPVQIEATEPEKVIKVNAKGDGTLSLEPVMGAFGSCKGLARARRHFGRGRL